MQMISGVFNAILPFLGFLGVAVLAFASTFLMISKLYIGQVDIKEIRDAIIADSSIKNQTDYLQLDENWTKSLTSDSVLGSLELKNIGEALSYAWQMSIGNVADPENLDASGYVA
jgi:hypothetical protein